MSEIFECCHKCNERHEGCHGSCEKYKKAKEISDAVNEARHADSGYIEYASGVIRKMRKKYKKRR